MREGETVRPLGFGGGACSAPCGAEARPQPRRCWRPCCALLRRGRLASRERVVLLAAFPDQKRWCRSRSSVKPWVLVSSTCRGSRVAAVVVSDSGCGWWCAACAGEVGADAAGGCGWRRLATSPPLTSGRCCGGAAGGRGARRGRPVQPVRGDAECVVAARCALAEMAGALLAACTGLPAAGAAWLSLDAAAPRLASRGRDACSTRRRLGWCCGRQGAWGRPTARRSARCRRRRRARRGGSGRLRGEGRSRRARRRRRWSRAGRR